MAIVIIGHAPNRAMYDAVTAAMEETLGGELVAQDGLIVHTASELADGSIQIVDVWATAAAAEAFEQNLLLPAFVTVGVPQELLDASPAERTETFELTTP